MYVKSLLTFLYVYMLGGSQHCYNLNMNDLFILFVKDVVFDVYL